MSEVTRILSAIEPGDPSAAEQLLPLVYDELRRLAAQKLAHEKPGQTLDATALVHEAYLRLVGDQPFANRRHFFAALEKSDPTERAAYLDEACGADGDLRRHVDRLLAAHPKVGSFLERPPAQPTPTGAFLAQPDSDPLPGTPPESNGPEQPGVVLAGRYQLLEQIGEGGMGTVWMAQQTEPVKRRVAVKLIKPGMDSKQVLARFEAERQALALMDHPHIAKVLDAGAAPDGRPFFVMELVKGVSITTYCDAHRLTPRQRLELFVPVCQAIQHAHQKGIIHRDVKPSNVLVVRYDERPVSKVIDFGVAKATGPQLTEQSLHTGFGAVVGTVEYMSPEQASFNQLDVDTRSDVYALGVLLYELLAGSPPFSRGELEKAGVLEMLRVIREQEPSKPSTKLSTAEGLPTLAANRGTEPAKLTRLVRGELDWIVMKALEKDRARRYESASAFAQDVQRYLHDEPVQACSPTAGYRLRKFVRRHKGPVLAASLIVLLLVGGIVGTTVGLIEARTQRDAAERARLDEAREKDRAIAAEQLASNRLAQVEAEKQRADEERAVAQAVNDFVQKDLLGQADLENQPGGAGVEAPRDSEIKVRTVLDRAAKTIATRFASQPRVEAAIRLTIAKAYQALGHYKEAQLHAERSVALRTAHLGADHADTLSSQDALAEVYDLQGFSERADALGREVLEKRAATLGPDHLDTLTSKDHMAVYYMDRRKYDLAEPLLLEVVQKREAQLGAHDPATLQSKASLAFVHMRQGKWNLAEAQYIELIKAYERTFGEDHPGMLFAKTGLGLSANGRANYAQAESLLWEVLQKRIALHGPGHPTTLESKVYLGAAYRNQRKYDQAVPMLEEAVAAFKASRGEDHPNTLYAMGHLTAAYRAWGKPELALPLYERVLASRKEKLPPDDDRTFNARNDLAGAYLAAKMPEKAITLYEEALTTQQKQLGSDDPRTLTALGQLADAYKDGRRPADAVPLFKELIRLRTAKQGAGDLRVAGHKVGLGQALLYLKKYAEAEPLLREALAVREKEQPGAYASYAVATAQSSLGEALTGQQKYAEAEPLLVAGYEGLKRSAAYIPAQSRNHPALALERLVQFYDDWDKPDEAAKWRKELEKMKAQP